MSRDRSGGEVCRGCGDRETVSPHVQYCDECFRKSSIGFTKRHDGEDGYLCNLCILAGIRTSIPYGEHAEHIREEHGFEWGDKQAALREHERLAAIGRREGGQEGIDAFA